MQTYPRCCSYRRWSINYIFHHSVVGMKICKEHENLHRMRALCLSFLFGFLVSGCNSNTTNNSRGKADSGILTNENADLQKAPTGIDIAGCYMRVMQRDTLAAVLEQRGDSVYGRLTFDNYEKDGSSGSVEGRVEDGIVKLVYTFHSEGMKSVMDVYFKADSSSLLHGTGKMQVKGDTAYFTNPSAVVVPDKDRLMKLPCEAVSSKYK